MEVTTAENFIDSEKVFGCVNREPLGKLMRHYRISEKTVKLVKATSDGKNFQAISRRRIL